MLLRCLFVLCRTGHPDLISPKALPAAEIAALLRKSHNNNTNDDDDDDNNNNNNNTASDHTQNHRNNKQANKQADRHADGGGTITVPSHSFTVLVYSK